MSDTRPEISEETDGTFTIMPDGFFDLARPIKGFPSRKLAERVIKSLWEAEAAGARHYGECEM